MDSEALYIVKSIQVTNNEKPQVLDLSDILKHHPSSLKIDSSIILTEANTLLLSKILSENLRFLEELTITDQTFSSSSIHILSQGLKSNNNLKKITLNSLKIPDLSLFYKISEALTLNESLTYIDLSNNSLNDTVSNSLLELLGVLPYLSYLNLNYNNIKDIQWGNILAVNTSLEQLHISYNKLRFESVANLLNSLIVNRNLKVLSLVGCEDQSEFYSKLGVLLGKVLKNSNLQSLFIEFDEKYEGINEVCTSLWKFNSHLVDFGVGEKWKDQNEGLSLIWRSLKANRWISFKLSDPFADLEIDPDFAEILEEKLTKLKDLEEGPVIRIVENIEVPEAINTPQFSNYTSGKQFKLDSVIDGLENAENELIAQIYNSKEEIPENIEEKSLVSTSIFNDSPRNFTYSDSSRTGTPILQSPRIGEKVEKQNLDKYFQKFVKNFEEKYDFDNEKKNFSIEFEELKSLVFNMKTQLEDQQSFNIRLQELFQTNEKNSIKREKTLQKNLENIEDKLKKIEKEQKKENFQSTVFEVDSIKDAQKETFNKIEKLEQNFKLSLNSLKKTFCSKQDFSTIQEKQGSLTSEFLSFSQSVSQIESQIEKFKQTLQNLAKTEKALQKKKEDHDSEILSLKSAVSSLFDQIENLPNLKSLPLTLQKDLDSKMVKLELKLWDLLESDLNKEIDKNALKTLETKFSLIDEKINKQQESFKEISKNFIKIQAVSCSERLDKLEKEILAINSKKLEVLIKPAGEVVENKTVKKNNYFKQQSPCIRTQSLTNLLTNTEDSKKPLESPSETNTFKKKTVESHSEPFILQKKLQESSKFNQTSKISQEISEFLPGEAESIVMSAIIDKANKARSPQARKSFSSFNFLPNQAKTNTKLKKFNYLDEPGPSIELQESLRQRGINL